MFAFFGKFLDWLRSLFWKEEMELTLVGLQNSGKTTFVNVIAVSNSETLLFNFSNPLAVLTHERSGNVFQVLPCV